MSTAEQYVDPDGLLALYRMHLEREAGRILLAYDKAEKDYNSALLARISHPFPHTVPIPDSEPLNELATQRHDLIAAMVDADDQMRWRGVPKDFLAQARLDVERVYEGPVQASIESSTDIPAPPPVECDPDAPVLALVEQTPESPPMTQAA